MYIMELICYVLYIYIYIHIYIYIYICTLNISIMDSNPLAVSHTCVMCRQAQLTHVWCVAKLNSDMSGVLQISTHTCAATNISIIGAASGRPPNYGLYYWCICCIKCVSWAWQHITHEWVEPGNTSHMCGKLLMDLNP